MPELCVTSRSCSVLLDLEGLYETRKIRELFQNGERTGGELRPATFLFDLETTDAGKVNIQTNI